MPKKKNIITGFSLMLFFFLVYSGYFLVTGYIQKIEANALTSPDAIAVRVIANPKNFSSARWYKEQGFKGSPQSVVVDGYEGIRDGRTVYVNAANIVGTSLFTNIYLISYNQSAETETEDIFSHLLLHWKFNTNNSLMNSDKCAINSAKDCLLDADCPLPDYCNSQKARIIRDVKRLADLSEFRIILEKEKTEKNLYPVLSAGSYLPGISLSTWPSWQKFFGTSFSGTTLIDPINKLSGCCADKTGQDLKDCVGKNFNPITCWSESTKSFVGKISKSGGFVTVALPSGSKVYSYSSENGNTYKLCTQTDTTYTNLASINCFIDKTVNTKPIIEKVVLEGLPKEPFNGYVTGSDANGDTLAFKITLIAPSNNGAVWAGPAWQWQWKSSAGNNFEISNTHGTLEKKIFAEKAGLADQSGKYRVGITLDDGRGGIAYGEYPITIKCYPLSLSSDNTAIAIGQSKSLALSGLDASHNPINSLVLKDFYLDGVFISNSVSDLAKYGFSIAGTGVNEALMPQPTLQKTGVYRINVTAIDPTCGGSSIDSFAEFRIQNNPPAFTSLTMDYVGSSPNGVCLPPFNNCSFSIDNSEAANMSILATDPDSGHTITYSLTKLSGSTNDTLTINPSTGAVSGFEKLNAGKLDLASYAFEITASDNFCSYTKSPDSCLSKVSFRIDVGKFCSLGTPGSFTQKTLAGPFPVSASPGKVSIGNTLNDCSEAETVKTDIRYIGLGKSLAIVFVLDFSKSMETNVGVGGPAYQQLKNALTKSTGVFEKLHTVNMPANRTLKVGMVGFNRSVWTFPYEYNPYDGSVIDIQTDPNLAEFKQRVNSYSTADETDTLAALNKSEMFFNKITGAAADMTDKILILMSDGMPLIRHNVISSYGSCSCSSGCGSPASGCYAPKTCPSCGADASCNSCDSCSCKPACGACTGPNQYQCGNACGGCQCCTYCTNCGPGPTPPPIGKKEKSDFKIAATTRTQCVDGDLNTCPNACPSDQYCSGGSVTSGGCSLSSDVTTEIASLKASKVQIYSIYYNTTWDSAPENLMKSWSSGNGYFYTGTDIDAMFDSVIKEIISKPQNIKFDGSVDIPPPTNDVSLDETKTNVGIKKTINCGTKEFPVTYDGKGSLEFTNLTLNYCPAKLHN